MKKHKQNSSFMRISLVILSLGLLVMLISTSKIMEIENSQEIYGLGDVGTISCDQGAFLDDFFGTNTTDSDCKDAPEYSSRQEQYDKLPMYGKIRLAGFVAVCIGAILFSSSFILRRRLLNQENSLHQAGFTIPERLARLEVLKVESGLSENEYKRQRSRILDDL